MMKLKPLTDMAMGNRPTGDLIEQVRVDTVWLPPIIINRPLDSQSASGPKSRLMDFLKPQVTITSPILEQPSIRAPYGVPTANYWPVVKIGLLVVGVLSLYGLYRLSRRRHGK